MNVTRLLHLCVAGMLVFAMAPRLAARASAGAAAPAREQQRQTPPEVRAYTGADLDAAVAASNDEAMALELTMPLIQQYYGVRTALLRAMTQSPALARQVLGASGRAGPRGVMGLEREYADIPAVVEASGAGQMTVHGYVVTEVAFMTAAGVLAGRISMSGKPPGAIGLNVKLLQQHQSEIAVLFKEAGALEKQVARVVAAP